MTPYESVHQNQNYRVITVPRPVFVIQQPQESGVQTAAAWATIAAFLWQIFKDK
jgi:hypothetical protein